ncbi:MAG: PQQ-binding-like beta-propeller repeat protein [Haloarculaceae archaeon]
MPSRRHLLHACAGALAALAGCSTGDRSSPANGTDTPTRTQTETPTETPTDTPTETDTRTRQGTDRIAWEQSVDGTVSARPLVDGDHLLVATAEGTVAALARSDGEVAWRFDRDLPIQGRPVVDGDTVVTVSGNTGLYEHQVVYAVDRATGEERWSFAPEEWWLSVLGTDGERAFVATHDDHLQSEGETLYALSLGDGTAEWSVEVGDVRGGDVLGRAVYVPSTNVVDAVALDGTRRWAYEGGQYQYATLTAAGGTTSFVTASDPLEPTVHGLATETGEKRWAFDDWRAHTTRTAGDRLFVGGAKVARLDPADGSVQWEADHPAALYDAPVADGTLYAVGDAAAAIATDDGDVGWTTSLDADVSSAAGLEAGRLLVHQSATQDDRDRHLLALDADDGGRAWTFAGRHPLTDPAFADGRAYLGERENVLALSV